MSQVRRALLLGGLLAAGAAPAACGGAAHLGPASGSPAPGSQVLHLAGTSYGASLYQEVGARLRGTGVTVNLQLLPSVNDTLARRRSVAALAAASSRPLGELPFVQGSPQLYVPVAFGAVAVIYNLSGLRAPLRLRGGVLSAIFQEHITRWNDPRIRADNRGEPLPASPITVVHRSDPSQSTDLFTQYLSASSPAWRRHVGSAPSVNWPAGTSVNGDDTLRQVVSQTPGAIGFTDQAAALQERLPAVHLRSAAGGFVGPSLGATTAVGDQRHPRGELSLGTVAARPPGAYPIAAELHVLTLRDLCSAGAGPAEVQGVRRLLSYLLGPGQAVVHRFSFAPLPPRLRAEARSAVRGLRCGGP